MKVIRDGKVAVLYSPGYGAGWSTWARGGRAKIVLYHPKFVEAAENGVEDIDPIAQEIFGDDDLYTGGWDNIRVAWLPVGTKFRIEEYDGSEHIECADDIEWSVA
jgi:hypothetical protein